MPAERPEARSQDPGIVATSHRRRSHLVRWRCATRAEDPVAAAGHPVRQRRARSSGRVACPHQSGPPPAGCRTQRRDRVVAVVRSASVNSTLPGRLASRPIGLAAVEPLPADDADCPGAAPSEPAHQPRPFFAITRSCPRQRRLATTGRAGHRPGRAVGPDRDGPGHADQTGGRHESAVERRVAASAVLLGLAARLLSPALAAAVLDGVLLDLDLTRLRWQPSPGSAFPMAVPAEALRPGPPGTEPMAAQLAGRWPARSGNWWRRWTRPAGCRRGGRQRRLGAERCGDRARPAAPGTGRPDLSVDRRGACPATAGHGRSGGRPGLPPGPAAACCTGSCRVAGQRCAPTAC